MRQNGEISRVTSVRLMAVSSLEDEHARALEEQWIDSLDGAGGTVDPSLDGSECIQSLGSNKGGEFTLPFKRSRWLVHDPSPRGSHRILFRPDTVLFLPVPAKTSCILFRCIRAAPSSGKRHLWVCAFHFAWWGPYSDEFKRLENACKWLSLSDSL